MMAAIATADSNCVASVSYLGARPPAIEAQSAAVRCRFNCFSIDRSPPAPRAVRMRYARGRGDGPRVNTWIWLPDPQNNRGSHATHPAPGWATKAHIRHRHRQPEWAGMNPKRT